MQSFVDIPSTDSLQNSRLKLINNDKTIMSCHSGTAFPTSNLEIGMKCFRTDLNQLYELKNLTPTWVLIADLNKTYTNKEYVDEQISNHGLHLPAKETASSKRFLRNDGTYQDVTPANIGAAVSTHVGATGTAHGDATTAASGFMSAADKTKLNGIATGANNYTYTHPNTDGSLHVPATGTNSSGKVLTAGSTAGSMSWQTPAAGMSLSTNVTVTASTETAWAGSMTGAGSMLTRIAGIAAGTYTLQNVIQQLVTKSHTHGSNSFNCNCACDGSNSN